MKRIYCPYCKTDWEERYILHIVNTPYGWIDGYEPFKDLNTEICAQCFMDMERHHKAVKNMWPTQQKQFIRNKIKSWLNVIFKETNISLDEIPKDFIDAIKLIKQIKRKSNKNLIDYETGRKV